MILTTLLLALAAPQTAAEPQASPTPAPKPKTICRVEGETGSRLSKHKRCMTAAEWATESEASRRQFDNDRDNSRAARP